MTNVTVHDIPEVLRPRMWRPIIIFRKRGEPILFGPGWFSTPEALAWIDMVAKKHRYARGGWRTATRAVTLTARIAILDAPRAEVERMRTLNRKAAMHAAVRMKGNDGGPRDDLGRDAEGPGGRRGADREPRAATAGSERGEDGDLRRLVADRARPPDAARRPTTEVADGVAPVGETREPRRRDGRRRARLAQLPGTLAARERPGRRPPDAEDSAQKAGRRNRPRPPGRTTRTT